MQEASLNRVDNDPKPALTNGGRPPNAEFALFEPEYDDTGALRDLRESYPQLNDYPEFSKLIYSDLHFVNAYANPSSPLVIQNLPDHEKIQQGMEFAYSDGLISDDRREIYLLHQWSEEIEAAVQRMKRFNVANRVRGHKILEDSFENLIEVNQRVKAMMNSGSRRNVDAVKQRVIKKYLINIPDIDYALSRNEERLIDIIAEELEEQSTDLDQITKCMATSKGIPVIINDLLTQMERTGIKDKKESSDRRDIFSDVRKKMSRR